MKIPRLLITGTSSGIGKTSISTAIIFALRQKGYSIQPFKVGPDYIDPSYLTAISGNQTQNLDVWIMGQKQIYPTFVTNSKSDISIIEGVMGYYDGSRGNSNHSSTFHISKLLSVPTILVLDASKSARSIAATALGFMKFHKNSQISGIILNKVGSKKHEILCRQAFENFKIPLVGIIPKNHSFQLESRHLGLIPIHEQSKIKQKIIKISKQIIPYLDLDKIIKISKTAPSLPSVKLKKSKPSSVSIAIALDRSFNFYYSANFDALRREGANIKFFSPISDAKIPKCDGIYIGGGFPEILANSLEKNKSMKKSITKFITENNPVYAECGGLMYLTNSISYNDKNFKTLGIFDAETKMTEKMILNYTKGKTVSNCIIAKSNQNIQGHEFHYSKLESISKDSKFAFSLDTGKGIKKNLDGLMEYNTLASYGHLYFDSSSYAKNFVKNCISFSRR